VIYEGSIFDLTDYIYTQMFIELDVAKYSFLDPNIVSVFEQQPGQTTALNAVLDAMDSANCTATMDRLSNAFYWRETDFRYTVDVRCIIILLVYVPFYMNDVYG
jgi:chitin synthase